MERRSFSDFRASPESRKLEGYAATFGAVADLGGFSEVIERGAFHASLGNDILALHDHDAGRVLGRTRSGTLRLYEDTRGLGFELKLPDTSAGRDVQALAERGDLGGMSFGFLVPDGGDNWEGTKRSLRSVDLKEISVVSAWPAYPDTEIALRAIMAGNEAKRRHRVLIMRELGLWDF
jgi:HK97 family phage prohead protease